MENKIKLNQIKDNILTKSNAKHLYKINLKKNNTYFFSLMSENDCEFNLTLYNSKKKLIKLNYHDDNYESEKLNEPNLHGEYSCEQFNDSNLWILKDVKGNCGLLIEDAVPDCPVSANSSELATKLSLPG